MMQARFAPVFLLSLLAAGCASPVSEYPSLAMRDGERVTGSMAAALAEPYIPASPAPTTIERVAQLAEEARAAHAAFLDAASEARPRVAAARGAQQGSEAWSVAQVAIAGLEAQRSRTLIALADIDMIYVNVSNAGEAIAPVADPRDEIVGLVEQQDLLIDQLLGAIAQ